MDDSLTIEQGIVDSLSLIIVIGDDASETEREEFINRAYISSLAVKDFVRGELDLSSFLDIQEYCLKDDSMDSYLDTVNGNLESLSFAELLIS